MTLYKENVSEIERLVNLSSEMGVDSLKINPVMPTGRGKRFFEKEENVEFGDLIKIDRWIEEELVSKYHVNIHFDIPIGLKSLKCIRTRQLFECNILNIIGILSDGTISLCGIGQTETALNMGNIAVDDIREVWANNSILRKLRMDIPRNLEGICGRCIFKFRCRGACRACAYGLTGSLNSPFFVCHEAYEKGLFLESRMIN
jgi:AdoMet-dependent heme synthase